VCLSEILAAALTIDASTLYELPVKKLVHFQEFGVLLFISKEAMKILELMCMYTNLRYNF
jgi:hypothetical protein